MADSEMWWPPVFLMHESDVVEFRGFVGHDIISVEGRDSAGRKVNVDPSNGDKLTKVEGHEVLGLSEEKVFSYIGGVEDSNVRLEFTRVGRGASKYESVEVVVKRTCPDRPRERTTTVSGLNNRDNSCFMNAVLQCVAHSYPDIHDITSHAAPHPPSKMASKDVDTWKEECEVALAYNDVCTAITTSGNNEVTDTDSFRDRVCPRVDVVAPSRERQVQEDAHQFLVMLWGSIDNAMSKDGGRTFPDQAERKEIEKNEDNARRQLHSADMEIPDQYATAVDLMANIRWEVDCKNKDRKLQQLMWGQYAKGIGCPKCVMWVDVKPEVYNILEVPVPEKTKEKRRHSLEGCISNFFEQEKADKGTKCPRCNYSHEHKGVEQKYVLLRLPDCLVIVLKRYTYKADYTTPAKNELTVSVPEVLDMHEHIFQIPHSKQVNDSSVYNLMGRVVHLGRSPRSGHYVSHVKHTSGKWYRISDKDVEPLSSQEQDNAPNNTYMLFYRRDRSVTPK